VSNRSIQNIYRLVIFAVLTNDAEDLALAFDLVTDTSLPVPDFSAEDLEQQAECNAVTSAVDTDGSNALPQEIREGLEWTGVIFTRLFEPLN
jgi:hypothetical protein